MQILSFDPCTDNYVHAYLNRPEVQEALHANVTKLGYGWEPCRYKLMSQVILHMYTFVKIIQKSIIVENYIQEPHSFVPVKQTMKNASYP